MIAEIITSYGRQYILKLEDTYYSAVTKGKKSDFVVGDRVNVNVINAEQAQIIDIEFRDNLVYREDENKSKLIASNVDQIIIVISVTPNFNQAMLDNCLVFAEYSGIKPLVLINKSDLSETAPFITKITDLYGTQLGYKVINTSCKDVSLSELEMLIANKSNLFIGQSGVGKSTITNKLHPIANNKVQELTRSLNSGKHTTTHATLYCVNPTTKIIDCPGMQDFGLNYVDSANLGHYFPEMRPLLGKCKFSNCLHHNEPNCNIKKHVNERDITDERYSYYTRVLNKLTRVKSY